MNAALTKAILLTALGTVSGLAHAEVEQVSQYLCADSVSSRAAAEGQACEASYHGTLGKLQDASRTEVAALEKVREACLRGIRLAWSKQLDQCYSQ